MRRADGKERGSSPSVSSVQDLNGRSVGQEMSRNVKKWQEPPNLALGLLFDIGFSPHDEGGCSVAHLVEIHINYTPTSSPSFTRAAEILHQTIETNILLGGSLDHQAQRHHPATPKRDGSEDGYQPGCGISILYCSVAPNQRIVSYRRESRHRYLLSLYGAAHLHGPSPSQSYSH